MCNFHISRHKSSSFLFWTINPVTNYNGYSCVWFWNARFGHWHWHSIDPWYLVCWSASSFLPRHAIRRRLHFPLPSFSSAYNSRNNLKQFSRTQFCTQRTSLESQQGGWKWVWEGAYAANLKQTWWSCWCFAVSLNWKTEGSKVSYHNSFLEISLIKTKIGKTLARAFHCNF